MRKHGLCCRPVSVCLSVRLSRRCILSTRLEISSNFFLGPVAYHSSFFELTKHQYPIPMGPSVERKIHAVGKFCDFRLKSPFISQTVRDRPWVAMEGTLTGSHRWRIDDQSVSVPMTLSELWRPDFKVTTFLKSNISKSLNDKVTITHKKETIPNISNGIMFGDLEWPLNASRRFVSISWASCSLYHANMPTHSHSYVHTLWQSDRYVRAVVLCYRCEKSIDQLIKLLTSDHIDPYQNNREKDKNIET